MAKARGKNTKPRAQQRRLKLGVRRVSWSGMSPEERRGWETTIELLKRPNPYAGAYSATAGRMLDRAAANIGLGRKRETAPPERGQPQQDRIRIKLRKLFGDSVPPRIEVPNSELVRRVEKEFEKDPQGTPGRKSILRAARRLD